MAVITYHPTAKVEVEAYKRDQLEDITAAVATITIDKSLYNPAGSFNITFLPIRDPDGASYYHRLSPMDYVSIRFARFAESLSNPPPIMRGFIDDVGMSVSVDQKGAPQRAYQIDGRDYGKIFLIRQIYYLVFNAVATMPDRLKELYGVPLDGKPVDIMKKLLEVVKTQWETIHETYKRIPPIDYLGSENIEGIVHSFSAQQWDRDIWGLMSHFDNSPWNELYITELENPTVVFRKTPWIDFETGEFIQGEDSTYKQTLNYQDKPYIEITSDDILNLNFVRSDAEVKNYYFTFPAVSILGDQAAKEMALLKAGQTEEACKSNPYIIPRDDEYAGRNRYGFRYYETASEIFDYMPDLAGKDLEKAKAEFLSFAETLNKNITRAMQLNSAYETGTIQLKGNERVRPGKYLKFGEAIFYVTHVHHELNFQNNQEYFRTTASFVRGTSYLTIKRNLENLKKRGTELSTMSRQQYTRLTTGKY